MRWSGDGRLGNGLRNAVLEEKELKRPLAVADHRLAVRPDAGSREAAAHLARLLESVGLFRDVEDVDAFVLADLLVVEPLRLRGPRADDHRQERRQTPTRPIHSTSLSCVISFSHFSESRRRSAPTCPAPPVNTSPSRRRPRKRSPARRPRSMAHTSVRSRCGSRALSIDRDSASKAKPRQPIDCMLSASDAQVTVRLIRRVLGRVAECHLRSRSRLLVPATI